MKTVSCTLSRIRILKLYINAPHWRTTIFAHLTVVLLSLIAIVAYARVVIWRIDLTPDGGNILGWSWGNLWLESLAFVPAILSIAWAGFTIPYLLATTYQVHPGYDIGVQIGIFALNSLPIAFAFSAYGPMQWMADGANPSSGGSYAGRWEIVGLLCLILLEFHCFLMAAWAWRRLHWQRTVGSRMSTRPQTAIVYRGSAVDMRRHSIWLPSSTNKSSTSRSNSTVGVGSVRSLYIEKGVDTERASEAYRVPEMQWMTRIQEQESEVERDLERNAEEMDAITETRRTAYMEKDPELPPPLKFKGSAEKALHNNGNSWQIVDKGKEVGPGW